MTDRELLQQALDALGHFEDEYGWGMKQKKAHRNLQIRLAQPEPIQREWVELTDDDMLMIYAQPHEGFKYSLGRMVQALLKEKNA